LRVTEAKETEYKPVVMETQPTLMLTGPANPFPAQAPPTQGFNNVPSSNAGYAIGGQIPSYQGYSM